MRVHNPDKSLLKNHRFFQFRLNANSIIYFDNRPVADNLNSIPARKRKVSMVFQDIGLWPHISVLKNILYVMNGTSSNEKKEKAHGLLKTVRLCDKKDRFPAQLSGGEKQRIALARALAAEPEILLLDEPFSNLEKTLRDKLMEDFKSILVPLNLTIIHVTHNQEEAFSFAQKIAIIQNGQLCQYTDPETLYSSPKNTFVASFLGYRTFLSKPIKYGNFNIASGSLNNGRVYAYRPEDIIVTAKTQKGWVIKDRVFKNGIWMYKLGYQDVNIHAVSENRYKVNDNVRIKTIKEPSIVENVDYGTEEKS